MTRHRMICLLLCSAGTAQSNLLYNGSFELGPAIPPTQSEVTVTGTQIPGWTVVLGNVDINGTFWSPSDGARSLDLHGIERGAIEQTFATTAGEVHEVILDLGAAGITAAIELRAAGAISPTLSHSDPSFPSVTYAQDLTWQFTAVASTTTLRIDSLHNPIDANGPHIDNVRVYARPVASLEPFGSGCAGSAGTLTLTAAPGSVPALGATLVTQLGPMPPGIVFVPIGMLGFSDSSLNGVPLPFDATQIGMIGCHLYASHEAGFVLSNVNGFAPWEITVPNNQGLLGLRFFMQGFVIDIPGNPFGLISSNAGAGRIGSS